MRTPSESLEFLNPANWPNLPLAGGRILIANPFLADSNFARSVVLLCEHGDEGTVGFVLNRPTELTLSDLLPDLYTPLLSIFQGGPVQLDTLHMLHRTPELYSGVEIAPGIFWGGSYDALQESISENTYQPVDLRLFVGYSGWSPGQLEAELEQASWIVADPDQALLFETDNDHLWRRAVESLGGEFANLANLPISPQLN
jgi:putative transcriptional regulator